MIIENNLEKKFKYHGIWWIPDHPEMKLPGTLIYDPYEGPSLELTITIDFFADSIDKTKQNIFLGISADGKEITLFNNLINRMQISKPGLATHSYIVGMIFIGVHFQRIEDIKFNNMYIHYLYLDEWVNISGFEKINNILDEAEIIIKYKSPAPIQAFVNDKLKISINFVTSRPALPFIHKEVTIKQSTFIKVEPSKSILYEEFRNLINLFQNFLSLALRIPVYPTATFGEISTERLNTKENYKSKLVEIYSCFSESFRKKKPAYPYDDVLFNFNDISDEFESYIQNWYNKQDNLKSVYSLYFGTLYNPQMYLENQFLNLIQAIESYHRYSNKITYVSDEEYAKLYDTILSSIPRDTNSELKDRLNEYLKYGNEFSLRKRLKEIFKKHNENIDIFVPDKKSFIDTVVNTRNFYTHHDNKIRGRAVTGEDLIKMNQILRMCIELLLMTEIGFKSEHINAIIRESRSFSNLNYGSPIL